MTVHATWSRRFPFVTILAFADHSYLIDIGSDHKAPLMSVNDANVLIADEASGIPHRHPEKDRIAAPQQTNFAELGGLGVSIGETAINNVANCREHAAPDQAESDHSPDRDPQVRKGRC
jgi:hypothetical protein